MTYDFFCCNCNRGVCLNVYGRCEVCNGNALIWHRETYTPANVPEPHELVYRPARGAVIGIIMVTLALAATLLLVLRGC